MEREGGKKRMIHIRLSDEAHRRLRILAAELDTSIQEWVEGIVIRELERYERGKERKQNS